jgi:uncharacterized protein YdaU (DUF1376 family)
MSARPWMPLFVADYLADTGHLSTVEHGAYLLLIMHYWANGGLPTDDQQLRNIAKLSSHNWKKIRGTLQKLFDADWRHKRIDAELKRTEEISEKRSKAAKERHERQRASASANAEQVQTHSQSQSQDSPPDGGESERAARAPRKKGTRLSDDWQPSTEEITFARGKGLTEQRIQLQVEKFRNYWIGKAGEKGVKLDWTATWRNWILSEIEKNGTGNNPTSGPRGAGDRAGADAVIAGFGAVAARRAGRSDNRRPDDEIPSGRYELDLTGPQRT